MRSPRSSEPEALPSPSIKAVTNSEVMTEAETEGAPPCIRCGECCRRYQVRLDLAEAQRIASGLGLTLEEFREEYADRRWPSERSILIRQENGCCPFLQRPDENGDELCVIHSFKPLNCVEWTPGLGQRDCRDGLARRWGIVVQPTGEPSGPDEKMRDYRLYIDSLASDRRNRYAYL